jgi:glycosyltransferase involved in cell wall biosynthesis
MKSPGDPRVSVCVTCYNQRAYIGECLDSILAQQLDGPIEVLVGDDGSVDGSVELIRAYARRDTRIVPIFRPRNIGFVENQHDLFRRSRGEFVNLCEGDDYWIDPDKLSRQLATMTADSGIMLGITAAVKVSERGDRLGVIRISDTSRQLSLGELILEISGRVPTASMLMRRSALMSLPQETYEQSPIDYALQVLVGAQGRIWYDASVATAYRVASAGSWTEAVATQSDKFLAHHEGLRRYQTFLQRQLDHKWKDHLRRAFEPLMLGFYMSSRARPKDKLKNLPEDLPLLSRRGRTVAFLLARMPFIAFAGALARRRIWSPMSRSTQGLLRRATRRSLHGGARR